MASIANQMRELVEKSMEGVDSLANKLHDEIIDEIRSRASIGETCYVWSDGRNWWSRGRRNHEVWCQVQNMLIADGFKTDSERCGGALRIYW